MSGNGELPRGWVRTSLGEVCLINPRSFLTVPEDDCLVSFVPMAAVEAITGQMDTSRVRPYREVKKGYTPFSEGDVLFAKITPCMENGKIAVVKNLENGWGCGSTEFHVLRPFGGISGELLRYYLLREDFRKEARRHMTGTAGQLRVPASFLNEAPFPLPPLPEQRRIVAEIERHFTSLDAAVAALQRARTNLKRYRASLLKAACEGRLVPTEAELARREGCSYEPASVLLERKTSPSPLRSRRGLRIPTPLSAGGEGLGVRYNDPHPPDPSNLPPLPEGWGWARAEQLCDFITKGTTPSAFELQQDSGEIPFIKVYNLTTDGNLDFSLNPTFIRRSVHSGKLARSRVLPGDVLMNIVGPPLGKVSIVPDTHPEWNVNQAIAIFRSIEGLLPKYLCFLLLNKGTLSWAVQRAKATAGQFNLTLEICRDLPIPLPPLAEQRRIVAEVERHMSLIQAAEAAVEANLKRSDRLRQAILKRAFEGKLVPQDPSDEAASVLLERIRAQRATSPSPLRSRRGLKTPTPLSACGEGPGVR